MNEQTDHTSSYLLHLLSEQDYATFLHQLDELDPPEASVFLESLPKEQACMIFRLFKKDTATEIFALLDSEHQSELLDGMNEREISELLDALKSETTEDMEMMAAILPSSKPYMETGIWDTWKKRIPWLLLLTVSATFTGAVITYFEKAIGTYAILTAFLPMLMDTGGNAGGQTSVTVIRGLSLGEIELHDIGRVLWKEFRTALLCGSTLASVIFLKIMAVDFRFRSHTLLENGILQNNVLVAALIALTVWCAVIVAKLVGTLLPMGAKRIGLDPAVMASPFITTIVDTITLILYFSFASLALQI
ncbi:MAG: magnesium transporter [Clostridia bacterium]|nr:magnesium transporter [Clostridia bacterium]